MSFENRAILLTGASRGLGRALAETLGKAGARLALVARPSAELEQVVASIRAAGGQAHAVPADLGVLDLLDGVAARAQAMVGPIELLIHNASTLGPTPLPALAELPEEAFRRVLEVNLLGPWRLTRALAGSMALRGGGTVVGISSDAAVEPYPGWGAYGASKAALDHLLRIWAKELAPVRFLSIDPGEMNTTMHAAAMPEADPLTLADPARVARWIVGRLAEETAVPSGTRLIARPEEVR